MRRRRISRSFRARAGDEQGFTIVEVLIAMMIMSIALVSLAYTANIAFAASARARRASGAALAGGRAIELITALDRATIMAGLYAGDSTISTDTHISAGRCVSTAAVSVPCNGETLITTAPATTPFNPHRVTETIGPTTYTVYSYVSWANDQVGGHLIRLTVMVTYNDLSAGTATKTFSRIYETVSGTVIGSTIVHYFDATGSLSGGDLVIYGDPNALSSGSGTLSSAKISLPRVNATLTSSPSTGVSASTTTLRTQLVSGATTMDCGGVVSIASADSSTSAGYTSSSGTDTYCNGGAASGNNVSPPESLPFSTSATYLQMLKFAQDSPSTDRAVAEMTPTSAPSPLNTLCDATPDAVPCAYASNEATGLGGSTATRYAKALLNLVPTAGAGGPCEWVRVYDPYGANTHASTVKINRTNPDANTNNVTVTLTKRLPTISVGCFPQSGSIGSTAAGVFGGGFLGYGSTTAALGASTQFGTLSTVGDALGNWTVANAPSGIGGPPSAGTVYKTATKTGTGVLTTGQDIAIGASTFYLTCGQGQLLPAVNDTVRIDSETVTIRNAGSCGPGTAAADKWTIDGSFAQAHTASVNLQVWDMNRSVLVVTGGTAATVGNVLQVGPTATYPAAEYDTVSAVQTTGTIGPTGNTYTCSTTYICYTVSKSGTIPTGSWSNLDPVLNLSKAPTTLGLNSVTAQFAVGETIKVGSESMTVSACVPAGCGYPSTSLTVTRSATPSDHSGPIPVTSTEVAGFNVTQAGGKSSGTITVGSEDMTVTSCVGTGCTGTGPATYALTRAVGGTTLAPHSAGDAATYIPSTVPVSINSGSPAQGLGQVVQIESEQMLITNCTGMCSGSGPGSATYTVTRAYGGTTLAAHFSNKTVRYKAPPATSFGVNLTTNLSAPFNMVIDDEEMTVNTCNGSTTCPVGTNITVAVTRAANGTSAAAHAAAATITRTWAPTSYMVNGTSAAWDLNAFNGTPAQTGWTGGGFLVRLRDVTETLTVSAGPGSSTPTYTRTGFLDYWDGSQYQTVTLGSAAPSTVDIPSLLWSSGSGSTTKVICQGAEATATPIGNSPPNVAYPFGIGAGDAPAPATSNPIMGATAMGGPSMLPPSMYLRMSNSGSCAEGGSSSNRVAYLNISPNTGSATAEAIYQEVTVPL